MLSIRLYGNGPNSVIGQTRGFPTGEADGALLREFDGQTSREQLCPEENMLVRSYVNARVLVEDDLAPVNFPNASFFAALGIKLRVRSCYGPSNQTLIDVGRQIVMPGNVGVQILAPTTFSTARPEDIEGVVEYFVQVVACKVTCCYPPLPHLTFWREMLTDAEEDDRTFVVPRGARRMQIGQLPAGIVSLDMWQSDSIIETRVISEGDTIDLFGAPDAITFGPAVTSTGNVLVRWEIEG